MNNDRGTKPVLVIIGVGGMGKAIARLMGSGKTILLADIDESTLDAAAQELRSDGHAVTTQQVDLTQAASVDALAAAADELGPITQVAHTAGLSPVQAPAAAIFAVDLVGTAHVLDAFGRVVAAGGAGVVVSSMAGHLAMALTTDEQRALTFTPTPELASLPFATADAVSDPQDAYRLSKKANQLRVLAASASWGARGARINSISPGIISTPMGQAELSGRNGDSMRTMISASGTGRMGTPEDIAHAAAFLLGPNSTFITGSDLLVDGGVVAALRTQLLQSKDA